MFNPYIFQIQQQTGMTEAEIRQSSRPAQLTLAAAQEHGFETVDEYEEAIREYIYGWVNTQGRLLPAFSFCVLYEFYSCVA